MLPIRRVLAVIRPSSVVSSAISDAEFAAPRSMFFPTVFGAIVTIPPVVLLVVRAALIVVASALIVMSLLVVVIAALLVKDAPE
jgi:hypothetical protein